MKEKIEAMLEKLRGGIRSRVQAGMETHEAQDAARDLCVLVDELELLVLPRKAGKENQEAEK